MAHRTRRSFESLMDLVVSSEKIACNWAVGTSAVPAELSADDTRPPRRDENKRAMKVQMTKPLRKEVIEYDRRHTKSCSQLRSQTRHDAMVQRREVYRTVDTFLQESIEKLDNWVIEIAERTVIDAMETCDVYHSKVIVNGALLSFLNSLRMSVLKNGFGIKDIFESTTIVQVVTIQVVLFKIAKATVTNPTAFAPIAQLAVEAVKSRATLLVKESAVMDPPSIASSGSDSSTDEEKKER